jgi:hypothetical protein
VLSHSLCLNRSAGRHRPPKHWFNCFDWTLHHTFRLVRRQKCVSDRAQHSRLDTSCQIVPLASITMVHGTTLKLLLALTALLALASTTYGARTLSGALLLTELLDVGDHTMHGHDIVHALPHFSMGYQRAVVPCCLISLLCTSIAPLLLCVVVRRLACLSASCMPCWHLPTLRPKDSLDSIWAPLSTQLVPSVIAA